MTSQHRKFLLRLPAVLHERIAEVACHYRRSMNAEIVARLEHALAGIPANATESNVEPAFFTQIEAVLRNGLSTDENTLVRRFRRLSPRQRTALMDLLNG